MTDTVVSTGERFRRRHNAEGAMEYWLEDASLMEIRKAAGIEDPSWLPPQGNMQLLIDATASQHQNFQRLIKIRNLVLLVLLLVISTNAAYPKLCFKNLALFLVPLFRMETRRQGTRRIMGNQPRNVVLGSCRNEPAQRLC